MSDCSRATILLIDLANLAGNLQRSEKLVSNKMCGKLGSVLIILVLAFGQRLAAFAIKPTASIESMRPRTTDETLNRPKSLPNRKKLDCSHLVHALYGHLGMNYQYATSRNLYVGIHAFRRVSQPEFGDLVVWRGHVGIVIDPAQHRFVSTLRSGVKTACYFSRYWEHFGRPRFFQYAFSDKKASRDEMAMALTNAAVQNRGRIVD
jgi:hypothetical protein